MFQLLGASAIAYATGAPPFGAPAGSAEEIKTRTVASLAAGLKAPPAEPPGEIEGKAGHAIQTAC